MKRLSRRRTAPPLTGSISMPGDKSISHRALIFSALAEGRSRVSGLNTGADVSSTRTVLEQLGATIQPVGEGDPNAALEVDGFAAGVKEPVGPLDCGNSGTTIRTMLGVLAGREGAFCLTGDESLSRRPMLRVVAPLRQMGADIDGRSHGDRAPLFVRGRQLEGIDHQLSVASAQVKTAILLGGLSASGTTTVTEPRLSRDHTERMLSALGADLMVEGNTVRIAGDGQLKPGEIDVPGDPSAAAFFVVAALLVEGSDLRIERVGTNPTRLGFIDALRQMGADVSIANDREVAGEPLGSMTVRASELGGASVDPGLVPKLVDEVPILAIAATQAEGETTFSGIGELRVKESDRIDAMAEGLTALGADVEAGREHLTVRGPTPLTGGTIDSHGDHRVAMAFAVAGLLTDEKVTIKGWSSIDVSFPRFLETMDEARQGSKR